MTLNEIQNRFQTALIYLSNNNAQFPKKIPEEILTLAQRFLSTPRMTMAQVRPEDVITSFLNLLVVASEIGLDLEEKANEIIGALETPTFFGS